MHSDIRKMRQYIVDQLKLFTHMDINQNTFIKRLNLNDYFYQLLVKNLQEHFNMVGCFKFIEYEKCDQVKNLCKYISDYMNLKH